MNKMGSHERLERKDERIQILNAVERFMNRISSSELRTGSPFSKCEADGLFVCYACGIILGYLSKDQNRIHRICLEHRLVYRNCICRCKNCGAVQWGYRTVKEEEKKEER